jgi:hypothetical protein
MAMLILPNLTLGILVWYLNPITPPVPSAPMPQLILTPVQPSIVSSTSTSEA